MKPFQRATVDHAFAELNRPGGSGRFLVADEVGLGKTMVARGLIERVVEHLRGRRPRIDVVYVCSNQAIARQNVRSLMAGLEDAKLIESRLNELALGEAEVERGALNVYAFTPATSLDPAAGTGRWEERRILYWLLVARYGRSSGLRNLMQVGIQDRRRWRRLLDEGRPRIARALRQRFLELLRGTDGGALVREGRDLIHAFRYHHDFRAELRQRQKRFIGRLRGILAMTCVTDLDPDLIVLDEFQRFKNLLDADSGDAETGLVELAQAFFDRGARAGSRTRVLLLSATPYRMYATAAESLAEDHYQDFRATMRFLLRADEPRMTELDAALRQYRVALMNRLQGHDGDVVAPKKAVEEILLRVMCRTERVAATADRNAMVASPAIAAEIEVGDLRQFLAIDAVARAVDGRDPVEYWKSAPYLLNFMRNYQLKREVSSRRQDAAIRRLLDEHAEVLLDVEALERYRQIDPANGRLRALIADMLDGGAWKLLWMPPSREYWRAGPPFAEIAPGFTKALVFSAWNVVPDVIAALVSHEVERRMLGPRPRTGYRELHDRVKPLLVYKRSAGRLSGMPVFLLQYPCLRLADLVEPREFDEAERERPLEAAAARIEPLIAEVLAALPPIASDGPEDRSWYWALPLLLDLDSEPEALLDRWLETGAPDQGLLRAEHEEDDDEEGEEGTPRGGERIFALHVRRLHSFLAEARAGKVTLGRLPDDLVELLALVALGAPGTLAARALAILPTPATRRREKAALVAEGLRSLFNQPVAQRFLMERSGTREHYWRLVLRHAVAGNLQAVLDEQVHLLVEANGGGERGAEDVMADVALQLAQSAQLRSSTVRVDPLGVAASENFGLRSGFAMRFGDRTEEVERVKRQELVRNAFNSPFRPFVLATTSVGQEGLDFHRWCHAVYHWNLPGNPVDLEQREGRVHRYKGHAVRKNVVAGRARSGGERRAEVDRRGPRPDHWADLFSAAAAAAPDGDRGLVPYWLCAGPHRVERRIPAYAYSLELGKLRRLLRQLASYRLAFGQPRQEEIVDLAGAAPIDPELLAAAMLDLEPRVGDAGAGSG
ncbi:MAG: helicase [Planctomycetes bacterium]|nr:helicase [Planctomycetota bacterium]